MQVIFTHKNWQSLEEGAVTKTSFYGVQKVWFEPAEGLLCMLLQSGYVYEHALERDWEYIVMNDTTDGVYEYTAVDIDGRPKGYFRS